MLKKVILLVLCALFLTACCPSMDRIVSIIDDILVQRTITTEATPTIEISAVSTPTNTPTPGCTQQPILSPVPTKTPQPSADHRFIVTKLPP